ncbi:MAG: hypothetical protein R3C58_14445 [Parvularculaceae bacterium]
MSAFLGELPLAAAAKLFAAIEADRRAGGKGLPHDALIADLRARLAEQGGPMPSRSKSAKRTFFSLFEDLFVSTRKGRKRQGQIARTSLDPIWRMMMTDPALTEAAMAAANLDDAYAAGEGDAGARERAMFIAAEAGLGRINARLKDSEDARDALVSELGGEGALSDLEEIRFLLGAADVLATLRVVVPSHAPSLDEEQLYSLRQLFISAYEQSPQYGSYLLLALKGRLEAPWRALGVYYHLARSADERLAPARDTVMSLPESLFEDLEGMARRLEKAGEAPLDAETARARLAWFADYADGLTRHAQKAGDNVFLNRIEACRDIAAEAHARYLEQAYAAMRAAMPVRASAGSSKLAPPRPDFIRPLVPETVTEARRATALLAVAADDAKRLGADGAAPSEIVKEAAARAAQYAGDLVNEIRAAEGQERAAARRLLEQTLSVIEPLLKSDEIGLLRDRAAAAAVTV